VFEQRQATTQCTSTMGKEGRRGAWVRQSLGNLDFCDSRHQGQQTKEHDLMSLSSFLQYTPVKSSSKERVQVRSVLEGAENSPSNFVSHSHVIFISQTLALIFAFIDQCILLSGSCGHSNNVDNNNKTYP